MSDTSPASSHRSSLPVSGGRRDRVVEGVDPSASTAFDATVVVRGDELTPAAFDEIAWALVDQRQAPYVLGPFFLDRIADKGGNRAVDVVFTDIPTSEELVDPSTYAAGIDEVLVDVRAPGQSNEIEGSRPWTMYDALLASASTSQPTATGRVAGFEACERAAGSADQQRPALLTSEAVYMESLLARVLADGGHDEAASRCAARTMIDDPEVVAYLLDPNAMPTGPELLRALTERALSKCPAAQPVP